MQRTALIGLLLSFTSSAGVAEPLLDNAHVTVWDIQGASTTTHDFVAVSLSRAGTASRGHRGETAGKEGERTIVIELKDLPFPTMTNDTRYPPAFPRKHARKLLDTAQVVVWDYTWRPGEPTPMHFHDKDAVVVFEASGSLNSTTPDGKITSADFKFGEVRFNAGNRSHSEVLTGGKARAVIAELK